MLRSKAVRYATLGLAFGMAAGANAQSPAGTATAMPLLMQPLAEVDGKEGLVLTVEYPPGVASPPHRHNANTFVYVLEGSVVMQVSGSEPVTLKAGDTFYESPNDIHAVSRNASATEPARILVFMVKDEGAPATLPAQ